MRPSLITRLEKLEAKEGDVTRFVIVIVEDGETSDEAVARATVGKVIDRQTLIIVIHRVADTYSES
jgi:hypothetical protein